MCNCVIKIAVHLHLVTYISGKCQNWYTLLISDILTPHFQDHHNVLSVEGLYLLTHADSTPPPPDMAPAAIVRCPLCEALLKAHYIKDHFMVCHAVQGVITFIIKISNIFVAVLFYGRMIG